jgi:NADH-quinone oxidoreductase subunit E
MGGVDTRDRTTSIGGRPSSTPSGARERCAAPTSCPIAVRPFEPIDLAALDAILAVEGHQPRRAVAILERTQEAYGHLPVAALQHIAHQTGAWYSELYGIATSYPHLRFEPPTSHVVRVCRCTGCTLAGGGRILAAFREHLGTDVGGIA